MPSQTRTDAAALDAAMKEPPFKAGYLEGAIRTAIIQIEADYINLALITLRNALKDIDA